MAIGYKKIEICSGRISSKDHRGKYKINVLFENRFSKIPIVTLCVVGSNKEAFVESATVDSFDIILTDTGQDDGEADDFVIQFQALNVVG